jgi:hypothetical protein
MLNFDWLSGVSPGAAKAVFLVLFVVIGLLVALVPRDFIYEGIEQPHWWHNLKLWAWGVLALIFAVYCIF